MEYGGSEGLNGPIVIPAPGDITSASANSATKTGHTHALNNSGVTAGSYTTANITVDAKGRVTAAANGNVTTVSTSSPSGFIGEGNTWMKY